MAPTPTVSFNVGGTTYEVSKSLLKQHPKTLMARMASDEWQQEQPDGPSAKKQKTSKKDACLPKAMFIDRDGAQFKYVLQYMRDRKVTIPYSSDISKTAVLDDLLYYGVSGIDETLVQLEKPPIINWCGNFIKQKRAERMETMKNIYYETIAQKCCEKALKNTFNSEDKPLVIDIRIRDGVRHDFHVMYNAVENDTVRNFDRKELEKHLATFDMKLDDIVEIDY